MTHWFRDVGAVIRGAGTDRQRWDLLALGAHSPELHSQRQVSPCGWFGWPLSNWCRCVDVRGPVVVVGAGLLRSTVVVLRRCCTWHKMPSICCESRLRAFFVRPPTSGRGSVGILQVIALTSADTPSFVCPSEIVKWDGLPFLGRHSAP